MVFGGELNDCEWPLPAQDGTVWLVGRQDVARAMPRGPGRHRKDRNGDGVASMVWGARRARGLNYTVSM